MTARVSSAARDRRRVTFCLDLQPRAEIRRRAERPFAVDPHQIDAAVGVEARQLLQQAGDVDAFGQARRLEAGLRHRVGRREDHRLEDAESVESALRSFLRHLEPARRKIGPNICS